MNISAGVVGGTVDYAACQGRLTLESGVPVSSSDQTGKTTLYFTPCHGNTCATYTGSAWTALTFTEISLALGTLTSGKNYDVFVYSNAGTATLELSAAWATDSARTDALTTQDGVYVKSGATTRRYVGTIRTTATTTTEDSAAKRFVWNLYNRTSRHMRVTESTDSWSYTTATWRQARASAANQLDYVVGLNEDAVTAIYRALVNNNAGFPVATPVGIGVNSITVNSAQMYGHSATTLTSGTEAFYTGMPGVGRNYLAALENGGASGTTTWFGDAGDATIWQAGIIATIWN